MTARPIIPESANTVANGKTGQTTFTAGALIFGNGTSALQSYLTTAGRLVIGNGASGITDDADLVWNDAATRLSAGSLLLRGGVGDTGIFTANGIGNREGLFCQAGSITSGDGAAGGVSFMSGGNYGGSGDVTGGNMSFYAGDGNGTGNGGIFNVNAGSGSSGGSMFFQSGTGIDESGGHLSFAGGSGATAGGDIAFNAGSGPTSGFLYFYDSLFNAPFAITDNGTNSQIGFFDGVPVGQQTLPAALAGGASLAQTITQVNAIRTALLNSTLMV